MYKQLWLSIGLIGAGSLSGGTAQAQPTDTSFMDARLTLGLSGEREYEVSTQNVTTISKSDLELTIGGGFTYVYKLIRYVGLGGQVGLLSWQSEAGDAADADRSILLDFSAVAQGILPVVDSVEVYVSVPLGLTLNFLGETDAVGAQIGGVASVTVDADVGVGFNFGLLVGVRLGLVAGVGLLAELGYVAHSFSHDITTEAMVLGFMGSTTTELDYSLGQLTMNLGAFF